MNLLHRLYHFLGSVYVAIALLFITATAVVAGTFLESSSGSHRYAAQFTYGHPLFALLICGFFMNILVSALRRWPFKRRHIPFLITHIGLLMLLAGVLVKNFYGVQGHMALVEGSGSHRLAIADSAALHLETQEGTVAQWRLQEPLWGRPILSPTGDSALSAELVAYYPNSSEDLELWTKGGTHLHIDGLPPVALRLYEGSSHIPATQLDGWDVYAVQSDDIAQVVREIYLKGLDVSGPVVDKTLDLQFEPSAGLQSAALLLKVSLPDQKLVETLRIPLMGPDALVQQNLTTPLLGDLSIAWQVSRSPTLLVVRNAARDEFFFAMPQDGTLHGQIFRPSAPESLWSLAEGFGGYAIQATLPATANIPSAEARRTLLVDALREGLDSGQTIAPPLQLLADACRKVGADFPSLCVDFLYEWGKSRRWLYPYERPLRADMTQAMLALDWTQTPDSTLECCRWTSSLTESLEQELKADHDLREHLRASGWPLPITASAAGDATAPLDLVHRQLFAVAPQLPPSSTDIPKTAEGQAHLLSAYMRAYGLHISQMPHAPASPPAEQAFITTSVTRHHRVLPSGTKLEDNTPLLVSKVSSANQDAKVVVSYDKAGAKLRWPVLGGQLVARFQPLYEELPYHLRLREARKISYPNSTQPLSYEADLLVTDRRTGLETETTLSMNRVYETPDGYRFYLSSISPADETAARHVQLAVNRDPAKYLLTYPGGAIIALGIILLFTLRPYRSP